MVAPKNICPLLDPRTYGCDLISLERSLQMELSQGPRDEITLDLGWPFNPMASDLLRDRRGETRRRGEAM